jgi:hypothetical protein
VSAQQTLEAVMKTISMLTLALILFAGVAAAPAHADLAANPKTAATQAALRDLWLGHVFWVRNVAMATFANDATRVKAAEEQVVANAKQIAGAIEPFYGKAAADKLFTLLAGHWGAVKAQIEATAKGDAKGKDAALKAATANAEQIATFLSSANPNLPKNVLTGLLVAHFGHHVAQNQLLKDKKYAEEATVWDAMRRHMYVIADALGDAIAKQFPAKF